MQDTKYVRYTFVSVIILNKGRSDKEIAANDLLITPILGS